MPQCAWGTADPAPNSAVPHRALGPADPATCVAVPHRAWGPADPALGSAEPHRAPDTADPEHSGYVSESAQPAAGTPVSGEVPAPPGAGTNVSAQDRSRHAGGGVLGGPHSWDPVGTPLKVCLDCGWAAAATSPGPHAFPKKVEALTRELKGREGAPTRRQRRDAAKAARSDAKSGPGTSSEGAVTGARRRLFWEILGGEGRLSAEMAKAGWTVLEPLEFRKGGVYRPGDDLLRPATRRRVWQTLVANPGIYAHFAIDCGTWSILGRLNGLGRTKESPWGDETRRCVRDANLVTAFLLRCVRLLEGRGDKWSIENPKTSYLWSVPQLRRLSFKAGVARVIIDQCEYGLAHPAAPPGHFYKKPTVILSNWLKLESLSKTCSAKHVHMDIRGSLVRLGAKLVKPTFAAGRYSQALCRAWAGCLSA